MAKSPFSPAPQFNLPGLNEEGRRSVNAAFDAMSQWRDEVAASTDRYQGAVFDKMGAAARALGWPDNLVEASRGQMQQVSKMQVHMIDQIMDAWQQQLKSPGTMPTMPGFGAGMPQMPGMPGMPGMGAMPGMPGMPDLSNMPLAPVQFWMQAAEMWQKSWQSAMSQWIDMQKNTMTGRRE